MSLSCELLDFRCIRLLTSLHVRQFGEDRECRNEIATLEGRLAELEVGYVIFYYRISYYFIFYSIIEYHIILYSILLHTVHSVTLKFIIP